MAATTVSRTEAARVFQQAIDTTIREHGEVGMQVAVYHNGQPVVDVWGGIADETTGRVLVQIANRRRTHVCAEEPLSQQALPPTPVACGFEESR
jgi:hypothetical protein